MKIKRIVFVLLTSMLFLTSCDEIKGDGNVVTVERVASDFSAITIDGVANVNVLQSEFYKVEVTTDGNLQEFVSAEMKNNVLFIKTESNVNLNPTKLMVDVYLPELKSIDLNGVGNVKLSNGSASDLSISLSGVGNIDAQDYQVENIVIDQSGVGNAKIWATNSLSGSLSGVGSISYKGNPMLKVDVSGIGKLSKL
jgi:hypothetical protein